MTDHPTAGGGSRRGCSTFLIALFAATLGGLIATFGPWLYYRTSWGDDFPGEGKTYVCFPSAFIDQQRLFGAEIGDVVMLRARTSPPAGWLEAAGQTITAEQHPAMFRDRVGVESIQLPDLRGLHCDDAGYATREGNTFFRNIVYDPAGNPPRGHERLRLYIFVGT